MQYMAALPFVVLALFAPLVSALRHTVGDQVLVEVSGSAIEVARLNASTEAFRDDRQVGWMQPAQGDINATPPAITALKYLEVLGNGSLGEIWRVQDPQGKQYARKKIPAAEVAESKEFSLQQSVLAQRGAKESIVGIEGSYPDNGGVVILLELLPSHDLAEKICEDPECFRRHRSWLRAPYDTRTVFRQLVTGLSIIHSAGVVHRDLNPDNIVCDDTVHPPIVKIGDFGSAMSMPAKSVVPFIRTGKATPEYAPPEFYKTGCNHGPEVDVWSLGVILYELVSGRLPFRSNSGAGLSKEIQTGSFEKLTADEQAQDLVAMMLKKQPGDRITLKQVAKHAWVKGSDNWNFKFSDV